MESEKPLTQNDPILGDFLAALLAGNRGRCHAIMEERLERLSIPGVYESLFRPALYNVGELWEYNRISVATEHMATAIVEGLMNALYAEIVSADRVNRQAVIAGVADEQHQVGAKMVADVFEMRGWDSRFLGADIPVGELIRMLDETRPDALGLSMTICFHLPVLKQTLNRVRSGFPRLPILVGGQGLRHGGRKALAAAPAVIYIDSLTTLSEWIDGQ